STIITDFISGTGGNGTYQVNISQTVGSTPGCVGQNNILTVTGAVTGAITTNQILAGTGVTAGTTVVGYISGSGAAGTYEVNVTQHIPATALTGTGFIGLQDGYPQAIVGTGVAAG